MSLHKHNGTMVGAMTPICNDCGISLCWDISEEDARQDKGFWDQWICQDCNGGESMSLQDWRRSHNTMPFTFFFGADNPLSNWHPAQFVVKGITFKNNEMFMMFCKAKLFKDEGIAQEILNATSPKTHKALGRRVSGFDETLWTQKCETYVYVGALEKFRQNATLASFLVNTRGTELVEASPYDTIWGVGLGEHDPRILDKSKWRGQNRLGNILMSVRDML